MNNQQSRRNFLKLSGTALAMGATGLATSAAASAVTGPAKSAAVSSAIKAGLPRAKGPRLVVVGGGTSGLTNNNYIYFNATVTGLDRTSRKLMTNKGEIDYDYLVVAPGIDYDYEKIGVKDAETALALHQTYPGGFTQSTEHVSIHRKVREFEGGLFLQSVPSGNYRCLPAPYERA